MIGLMNTVGPIPAIAVPVLVGAAGGVVGVEPVFGVAAIGVALLLGANPRSDADGRRPGRRCGQTLAVQ